MDKLSTKQSDPVNLTTPKTRTNKTNSINNHNKVNNKDNLFKAQTNNPSNLSKPPIKTSEALKTSCNKMMISSVVSLEVKDLTDKDPKGHKDQIKG